MEHTEKLWKQYEQHINTYKFYLEVLVKIMTMYFAVTGAMLSFYFTKTDVPTAKLALYLPLIMSAGLFIFFSLGAYLSTITRSDVFNLRDKLELEVSPELGVLTLLLIIFSIVTLSCTIGLGLVLWCKP
jgi:hypothetical protein